MVLKTLLHIVAAVFLSALLFFLVPTQWLYYILIGAVVAFAIMRSKWLLAAIAIGMIGLFAGLQYFSQTVAFLWKVYSLIMPDGFNMNWLMSLPQFFEYVLPTTILIMICLLGFVGTIYRGWADYWLAESFSSLLVYVFFLFTILNVFFVGATLYEVLHNTPFTLFIWECIFQWLPFLALDFILYYYLGAIFNPPTKVKKSSKEMKRKYEQQHKRR